MRDNYYVNAQILALNDLHSKLYLFDNAGIMGSANFINLGNLYNENAN